jgi:hypothetical protein
MIIAAALTIIAGCSPQEKQPLEREKSAPPAAAVVSVSDEKAESGRQAIDSAQALSVAGQKKEYLLRQAQLFYDSKEFQETINIAQYVIRSVDADTPQAQDLLEKAKQQLKNSVTDAVGNMKEAMEGLGK